MSRAWAIAVSLLVGCAKQGGLSEASYVEPDVAIWAEQLGTVLGPAKACVDRHPEPGASIFGFRTLRTGETSFLTYSEDSGAVVCVHDGQSVVHLASVTLSPEQLARLPFVVLGETPPALRGGCPSLQELYWGSRFIGWLAEPCGF